MTAPQYRERSQGVPLLSTFMKIQMVAFLLYGVTFFLLPGWTLGTIFGFDELPPLGWPRVIGAVFLAITLAEYLSVQRLAERLDLAWFFAAVPGLILLGFIWDRVTGIYEGSELFYWVSIAVTAFFLIAVGGSRLRIRAS